MIKDQLAKLGTTKTGRGDKNKRIELKKNKILEDNILFEDEEADSDANREDEFEFEGLNESEAEDLEDMLLDSEGELVSVEGGDREEFIPRCKLQAYMVNEGLNIKTKSGKGMKFTKATDPRVKEIMTFMGDENINCPQFLPMNYDDAKLTNVAIESTILNPHIPLSEHVRKENFFKFFQGFN